VCGDWYSYAHMMATLTLLISLVVMSATKVDALRPRVRLRAEALGCLHVWNAPSVEGVDWKQTTTLSDIRLLKELEPHSVSARRADLPTGRAMYHTMRLVWVADSMTDSIRVIASDGLIGATMSFAASTRSPWSGRAEAWTDALGNERNLGRIRVDRATCSAGPWGATDSPSVQ
jgi:hypothetical protein